MVTVYQANYISIESDAGKLVMNAQYSYLKQAVCWLVACVMPREVFQYE